LGHREYVGGLWEEIGNLQFSFLLSQGLSRRDYLMDIACGSLRLGVKAIPYLDSGHYLGVEKEPLLLEAGVRVELGESIMREKKPRLLCHSDFAFDLLATSVDMAIAQSLFTHIPSPMVERCLSRLRPWLKPEGRFFATFFESESERENPSEPDDHGYFAYTRRQMEELGAATGYVMQYIGPWNHPRDQRMVVYRVRG
jgi:hypothetical protein